MQVLVSGISGHMGKIVSEMIKEDNDLTLACGVCRGESQKNKDEQHESQKYRGELCEPVFNKFTDVNIDVDIIVDFSNHTLTKDLLDFAISKKIPVVIATTGQTAEEKNLIIEASKKIPIFYAANYSLGIAVLIDAAKKVASTMKDADIEIIETHHNRKLDAPSGTALKIANELKKVRTDANFVMGRNGNAKREKNDIGINSIRLGNVVGIHEVIVSTDHESISLKHTAYDRGLFAEGAIKAVKYMVGKKCGMYGMEDLLNEKNL